MQPPCHENTSDKSHTTSTWPDCLPCKYILLQHVTTVTVCDTSRHGQEHGPFISSTVYPFVDSRLSFDAHISAFSQSCFYNVRANLTLGCSKNIACSLVGYLLDYANSTHARIYRWSMSWYERIQRRSIRSTDIICHRPGCQDSLIRRRCSQSTDGIGIYWHLAVLSSCNHRHL